MGRTAKPWFYRQTGWWMVWLNGRKVKLAEGKKNKKAAEQRLLELRFDASRNPGPDSPNQTVASVIETYQGFAKKRLAQGTIQVRWQYLQSFAECHGWRRIIDSKPHHMEAWLDGHPEWQSDWTKCSAILNVQVAFNWAARNGMIDRNPFKGVTHRPGLPRRAMTFEEFIALLRASEGRRAKRRPSPAARFRQVLVFLWHTGCRPKEAATLKWSNVDFENSIIVFKEHKTAKTQRTPMPRIIPMVPVVERLLRSIQQGAANNRMALGVYLLGVQKDLGHGIHTLAAFLLLSVVDNNVNSLVRLPTEMLERIQGRLPQEFGSVPVSSSEEEPDGLPRLMVPAMTHTCTDPSTLT